MSADVLIADPPYSSHVHANLGKEDRGGDDADGVATRKALTFDSITDEEAAEVMVAAARGVRRWVLVFCNELAISLWVNAGLAAGLRYVRVGVWVKSDAMPQMSGDRPSAGTESIVIMHVPVKGRMQWNGGGRKAVWTGPAQERDVRRVHPCQKPLWLLEALVRDFSNTGETIWDPYMGSGTTGAAARRNGRDFIGHERDAATFRKAETRILATREQLGLFHGADVVPISTAKVVGR